MRCLLDGPGLLLRSAPAVVDARLLHVRSSIVGSGKSRHLPIRDSYSYGLLTPRRVYGSLEEEGGSNVEAAGLILGLIVLASMVMPSRKKDPPPTRIIVETLDKHGNVIRREVR